MGEGRSWADGDPTGLIPLKLDSPPDNSLERMAQGALSPWNSNESITHGPGGGGGNLYNSGQGGSSFRQYNAVMPNDQMAKLLAMHRESAANAGIYVAVVLAVYVVLLSLLLCRYVRRRPSIRELPPIVRSPSTPAPSMCPLHCLECVTKPDSFFGALQHCTFKSGAGVSSLSSDDEDHHRSHHRNSNELGNQHLDNSEIIEHTENFDSLDNVNVIGSCSHMDPIHRNKTVSISMTPLQFSSSEPKPSLLHEPLLPEFDPDNLNLTVVIEPGHNQEKC